MIGILLSFRGSSIFRGCVSFRVPGYPPLSTQLLFFSGGVFPRNLLLLNPASKAFRLVVGTAAERALKLGAAKVRYEPFWGKDVAAFVTAKLSEKCQNC